MEDNNLNKEDIIIESNNANKEDIIIESNNANEESIIIESNNLNKEDIIMETNNDNKEDIIIDNNHNKEDIIIDNNHRNKEERLKIVLDIINKLKNFNINNENVNLYNSNYSFIKEFKIITNMYINGTQQKGYLEFSEINKKIEYNFPLKTYKKPLFVIRMIN